MKKRVVRKTKKNPTISLCMIVKNEEAFLAQCLDSVKDCVDEMIIVDTGSTDRTVEIAESYGARIYHHPWENDYSKHRNQSLSYVTGDWILILDADEELFAEDRSQIKHDVRDNKVDYYSSLFHDINNDGSLKGFFNLIRLFRNNRGMHFTKKVHEQLQIRGKGAFSSIRIKHYGYDLTPEKMEAKHIRTTAILKEMLATTPEITSLEKAYLLQQLSASYSMHHEPEKAVEYGEMSLEVIRRKNLRNDFSVTAFLTVAQGYYALRNFEDAERICLAALDYYPLHLDASYILAAIYWDRQSFVQCRSTAERYLHIHEAFVKKPSLIGGFYCNSFSKRYDILNYLAKLHFAEKNLEKAEEFFMKAFEDAGRTLAWADMICRFYLTNQTDEKFLQWLATAYEAGTRENAVPDILQVRNSLYLRIGQFFLQRNNFEAAYDCLQKASDEYLSSDEQIAKQLHQATISWLQHDADSTNVHLESLRLLLHMDANSSLPASEGWGRIVYDIAEALCLRRQWPLAEPALQLAIQIAPQMFDHDRFDRLLLGSEMSNSQPS